MGSAPANSGELSVLCGSISRLSGVTNPRRRFVPPISNPSTTGPLSSSATDVLAGGMLIALDHLVPGGGQVGVEAEKPRIAENEDISARLTQQAEGAAIARPVDLDCVPETLGLATSDCVPDLVENLGNEGLVREPNVHRHQGE